MQTHGIGLMQPCWHSACAGCWEQVTRHIFAEQQWLSLARVSQLDVPGMHERGWAMVYSGDDLPSRIRLLHQTPQLLVEGAIPCDTMAACALMIGYHYFEDVARPPMRFKSSVLTAGQYGKEFSCINTGQICTWAEGLQQHMG